jgi:hypothetical protein
MLWYDLELKRREKHDADHKNDIAYTFDVLEVEWEPDATT